MPFLPVDPGHATNPPRDDGFEDFAVLKAKGQVRDKRGAIISIDKPHTDWTALQRDELYQGFCAFAKVHADEVAQRRWVEGQAARLGMSFARATDIINQGNGQWLSPNSRWWRGVSV